MKKIKLCLLLVLSLTLSLGIAPASASAASDYDELLQTSPSLYVYTDGYTKSKKMDISGSWWSEFKQTYAKRVLQGIGWPTNFATEFEDIVHEGGTWGIFERINSAGRDVWIVGTRDPDAYCGFVGTASSGSYQCTSHSGYGYVSAHSFTHNSYGGNGCIGSWANRCSDNGMNIYEAPVVQTGTAGYTLLYLPNDLLPHIEFYHMNFDLNYPVGYEGELIPEGPPAAKYVAMGDSYSSGEGNPPFEAGTNESGVNECHRSPKAYPRLLQFDLDLGSTAFVACSGATTDNVLNGGQWNEEAQIDALSEDTEIITITIGGNDVGFKEYVEGCVGIDTCGLGTTPYSTIIGKISDIDFEENLVNTYETILENAPNAQLYVVDYPYLTADDAEMCGVFDFSGGRNVQVALNSVIEDAVDDVYQNDENIHYVPTNYTGSPFEGMHYCNGGVSDFNGFDGTNGSFHPNNDGQSDYAEVIENFINP